VSNDGLEVASTTTSCVLSNLQPTTQSSTVSHRRANKLYIVVGTGGLIGQQETSDMNFLRPIFMDSVFTVWLPMQQAAISLHSHMQYTF